VGLLAGVCSDVDGQGAALDERLSALAVMACVRPLICVDSVMSLKIGLAVETLLCITN
jgi:hypothetical protein